LHHLSEVPVRGGYDSNVNVRAFRRANSSDKAVIQDGQELWLPRKWKFRDFIKKESAPVDRFEETRL